MTNTQKAPTADHLSLHSLLQCTSQNRCAPPWKGNIPAKTCGRYLPHEALIEKLVNATGFRPSDFAEQPPEKEVAQCGHKSQ